MFVAPSTFNEIRVSGAITSSIVIELGAIQVLRNAIGGGGCQLSRKKLYEGVQFNVLALRGGGWGSIFQE